jgi:hypothetical protein
MGSPIRPDGIFCGGGCGRVLPDTMYFTEVNPPGGFGREQVLVCDECMGSGRWDYWKARHVETPLSATPRSVAGVPEGYWGAREEHAFLLRCEGLTLQQVGDRLGVCRERARQMISKFGFRFSRAMKQARIRIDVQV